MIQFFCFCVLYLAEALIAWLYFEYLYERKTSTGILALSFFVGYAILLGVYYLNITIANTLSFFVVNSVLAYLNYRCTWKAALLQSAFLSFIMTVAEILMALVISLFGHEFAAYTYNFSVMVALIVLSKLLYLIFSVICVRVFAPHTQKQEDPKMMVFFCGLPIFSMLMSVLIVYLGSYTELTTTTEIMIVLVVFALMLINLVFLVIYNILQKVNAERLALQLSVQKEEADAAYYGALREQYEKQRILIHDIKNHLQTIDGLLVDKNSDAAISYVSQISKQFDPMRQVRYCADPVLNMILVRYSGDCQKLSVALHCDIRDNGITFMDALTTTTLFGNLLSNALEAAVASAERSIELSIVYSSQQDTLLVSIVNSCDTAPTPDRKGGYQTRKKNSEIHGIGLKSIERVVKALRGVSTMYYSADEKQFHHIIQFPVDSNTLEKLQSEKIDSIV